MRLIQYLIHKHMDEREFLSHINQHQRIIHKICRLYAVSQADREDLFQEILMQAWRAAPQFRQEAGFSTWLYRIGLNTAISQFRKSSTRPVVDPIDVAAMQLKTAEQSTETEALYAAISELGKVDKAIVMLWLDDFDYADIGEILGITANHVGVKMSRIREKLKSGVKQHL